jgi:hypothetical protein
MLYEMIGINEAAMPYIGLAVYFLVHFGTVKSHAITSDYIINPDSKYRDKFLWTDKWHWYCGLCWGSASLFILLWLHWVDALFAFMAGWLLWQYVKWLHGKTHWGTGLSKIWNWIRGRS